LSSIRKIFKSNLRVLVFCSLGLWVAACGDRSHSGPDRSLPGPTVEQVAAVVRKHDTPDVLLIQETPWLVKMKALAEELGYPHFVSGRKMAAQSNLAIFSKTPLSNPNTIPLHLNKHKKPTVLSAEILINNKPVLFCSVHLTTLRFKFDRIVHEQGGSPISSALRLVGREYFRDTEHSRSVETLVKWIKSKPHDAVIIGGDFNTFLFTKPIRIMNRRLDDALWPSVDYFAGTYRHVRSPVKPRIDYIYYSEGINRIKAEIIRETPGDHYPIRAVFGLDEEKRR